MDEKKMEDSLPQKIQGTVIVGQSRGKGLGFPTANLNLPPIPKNAVPLHGIFFGSAVLDSQEYQALISIGPNLTFLESNANFEVHLLGGTIPDFYGKTLNVTVKRFLRAMQKFDSVEELITAMQNDVARALQFQ